MNDSDPPSALSDDQCVNALNVEWVVSMLGERRRGATAIDIAGSDLVGKARVPFLHRHLPTSDESAAELFALGVVTNSSSASLCRKTTTWSTVTLLDAITLTGSYQYQLQAQTIHGKMFVAYKSGVDRLHVWDGTTVRRAGMAAPTAAPTGADTASGTGYTGSRYARVREVVVSGSTVLRRSEPSPVLTFAPSGSKDGAVFTKPADMGESATHWEIELSLDNANWYRMARTVVATTTYTDNVVYGTGYATTGTLSETSGAYTPIHSGKYLLVDEDRLIILSSFEDDSLASRMAWTPVFKDPGQGNDERIPLDPVSFRDLDTFEGGGVTGGIGPVNGEIWVFKWSHVYKANRTGERASAYDVLCVTKKRGALPGSMIEAVDEQGIPCGFFLDPKIGPCMVDAQGIVRRCGKDILNTWRTVNTNAASVVSRAVFYEEVGQVHWFVATGSSDTPNKRIVLHVDQLRGGEDGVRKGWSVWNGPSAAAISVCLFSTNVDAGVARNRTLVPFVGLSNAAAPWRTDTGRTDNGTEFVASVQTKPYAPATILNNFKVASGSLLAKATAGASVVLTATRNFGIETKAVEAVSLVPEDVETQVIRKMDDLTFAELKTVDFTIADGATSTERWEVNMLALKEKGGQSAT